MSFRVKVKVLSLVYKDLYNPDSLLPLWLDLSLILPLLTLATGLLAAPGTYLPYRLWTGVTSAWNTVPLHFPHISTGLTPSPISSLRTMSSSWWDLSLSPYLKKITHTNFSPFPSLILFKTALFFLYCYQLLTYYVISYLLCLLILSFLLLEC